MAQPKTLLEMAGADPGPAPWDTCVVVMIDFQNEYLDGALALFGVEAALAEGARLLKRARAVGAPVIHIRHQGKAGGAFDPDDRRGAICEQAAAGDGEAVIMKTLPNAFAGTDLDAQLKATGRTHIIAAGFMTHMCVSATVRSCLDHGYGATVVAGACATRDLPDGIGGVVPAAALHRAELAALGDRFATLVPDTKALN